MGDFCRISQTIRHIRLPAASIIALGELVERIKEKVDNINA
ncbi:hypothetical protein B4168_2975 [Anoxybacillus flavithermus]|nr:hypothetical protein B4168_2975 [Anoxybacillus flavithermus]OAO86264.1 hypothetical protein GT23_2157 [Parageobacillus thermoglucosidasius]